MPPAETLVYTEAGSPCVGTELTLEQKRTLYRDGFLVLKGVVPRHLTGAAKRRIFRPTLEERKLGGKHLASARELTELLNASPFAGVLRNTLGEFDPPTACQVAVTGTGQKGHANMAGGASYNLLGYPEEDFPYYNAAIHMDGLYTAPVPQERPAGTEDEIYFRYLAGGLGAKSERWDLGRSANNVGTNTGPLFQDRECTLATGSFTAFAVICLNDQMVPGHGQFSVLRGGHHTMEKFYRMQYEAGGIIGPEGPGWPRLDHDAPNRCGLVYLPECVREHFLDETSEATPDGVRWPRPTQVLMEEGDVCITLHAIPHSASTNKGTEPRSNIIFRIRAKKRQPGKVHGGASDHPDRGHLGEFLEYEEGNDPFERSKFALCNIWHEWDGMRKVVEEEKARERATGQCPVGAGPDAVQKYREAVAARPSRVPVTPKEATAYYADAHAKLLAEGKLEAQEAAEQKTMTSKL